MLCPRQSGRRTPQSRRRTPPELEALADAANEAAKRDATQWFFLVMLMVYLAIAVGSTTHRMLLLESPVQLPISTPSL
jgi:hypothetical protein